MFSVGTVVFLLVVVLHLASSANLRPHLVENGEKLGVTRNPDTVDELDVKAYLGGWAARQECKTFAYFRASFRSRFFKRRLASSIFFCCVGLGALGRALKPNSDR